MIKERIKDAITYTKDQRLRRSFFKRDEWMVEKFNLPPLTSHEIKEVNNAWPFLNVNNNDLIWTRVYKSFHGFNPFFITDYHLIPIFRNLNRYKQVVSLENKAMVDVYFPSLPFPKNYIKCLNGSLYNSNLEIIDYTQAYYILKNNQNSSYIIKPSVDTGCGKGVEKFDINDKDEFCKLLNKSGDNFVIQEVLTQNKFLHDLNPSSINSCRITSILINGKFSVSGIIKVGKNGSIKDNWNSSYFIGLDDNGSFKEKGVDSNMNLVACTDTHINFSGLIYPMYDKMISFVEKSHNSLFPNIGIIGWDIFIDDSDQPKLIEVNLSTPGVVGEQFCTYPFFESRRDDIINRLADI